VVNISSVNAKLPQSRLVAQSAAKAALSNLGKALAEEFSARGLRVNTISPGPVRTDLWTSPGGPGDVLARRAGVAPEDFTDQLPAAIGLSTGRFADPEEIAALVVFLASGRVANMSGSDLVIDGGMLKFEPTCRNATGPGGVAPGAGGIRCDAQLHRAHIRHGAGAYALGLVRKSSRHPQETCSSQRCHGPKAAR
jgi:hypothetical protein